MDPFYNIVQRDLAEKASADVAALLRRIWQLADTQQTCVIIGVGGLAGVCASLVGAFYAAYPQDEITEEAIDAFWRDLARPIVVATMLAAAGPVAEARKAVAEKAVRQ